MTEARRGPVRLAVAGFVVLGLSLAAAGCTNDGPGLPEDPPAYVLDWGPTGDPNGNLKRPIDVAVGHQGAIHVADIERGWVLEFTPSGEFLNRWDIAAFLDPEGLAWGPFNPSAIAVDTSGVIFVSDVHYGYLVRLDTRAGTSDLWGYDVAEGGLDAAPDGTVFLVGPHYVTFDHPVDAGGPYILKLSSRGEVLAQWRPEFPPGRPWRAGALARTPEGGVLVLDVASNRVQEYDSKGVLIADWGLLDPLGSVAWGLALSPDGGRVYVSRLAASVVEIYSRTGGLLSVLGSEGPDPGQFGAPHGLVVDASGALYVTDFAYHRVQKFAYP